MPLVAAWRNQLVEKAQEQGGVFCDSEITQSIFAAFKTHFGYTFIIPTSGNILMRLGSVYRSTLLTSTFSEISRLLMHRRFNLQCRLWPIIQVFVPGRISNWIYKDCQRYRASIVFQDSDYSYCQYILRSLKQTGTLSQWPFIINYASTDLFFSHLQDYLH